MAVQEDHDFADHLLPGPRTDDSACAYWADAVHLSQAIGLYLDDVEHLLAKRA